MGHTGEVIGEVVNVDEIEVVIVVVKLVVGVEERLLVGVVISQLANEPSRKEAIAALSHKTELSQSVISFNPPFLTKFPEAISKVPSFPRVYSLNKTFNPFTTLAASKTEDGTCNPKTPVLISAKSNKASEPVHWLTSEFSAFSCEA